ncbi:MAG: signal peptidase I [bacterium]
MKVAEREKTGIFRMIVKGKSMEPAIMENSNVIVEKAHPFSIKRGDVVVFKWGKKIIIHRIIGIHKIHKDLFFVEKGDNLPFISIFPQEALIGKVCGVENREVINLYSKNFVNTYLVLTYFLFKSFQIMQRLSNKVNKKLGDIVFNAYFIPFRFFLYFISYIQQRNS